MGIYVRNYRKTHEQLNAVIDVVTKNSKAIKKLYGMCVLNIEEQESLETLDPLDAEILALFLGEYRDENGLVPDMVRDYNRGVLRALNQKIPTGSLDSHQIRRLKAPKIVYRCFMEQCAVDGTIDTQEWSDKIYEDIRDFELSDNSKSEIKESVKYESEIAGIEYFLVKYSKDNIGVFDTDFVLELGEDRYVSADEQAKEQIKAGIDNLSLFIAASSFSLSFRVNIRPDAFDNPIAVDSCDDSSILNDEEYKAISLDILKDSVKESLSKNSGFVRGIKISRPDDNYKQSSFLVIITTEYFFIFINEKIAVIPIPTLQTVSENEQGVEIKAWRIDWYNYNGESIEGDRTVSIERNRKNNSYIRAFRKGFERFIELYHGHVPSVENQIKDIVGEYIQRISKGSPTYMVKDIKYNDEKTKKRLKNALSRYALKVHKENVIGFIDTSLLSSGKDGLLFSTDGIAFDYAFEKVFIHYDEIDKMTFDKEKKLLLHGSFAERKNDSSTPSINDTYFDIKALKECIQKILYIV